MALSLRDLLAELDTAQAHSLALVDALEPEQIAWRPHEHSSAIAWHLGHQAAVAHYMVRNLTAAEPSFDESLDAVFDSATPEPDRGDLPSLEDIVRYRSAIAASTHRTIGRIDAGDVGAPVQLRAVAEGLLRAIVNHEYQHATWIAEVRAGMTSASRPVPTSAHLVDVEGYWMLAR